VIPRGVIWKGEVSVGIGISPLSIKVFSLVTGFISSMSKEDIGIETPGGLRGKSSSEGSQTRFQ